MDNKSCSGNGISMLWFLAGLGLGTVAGVLYAPKAGIKTRESILDAAKESCDVVQERARKCKHEAQQWAGRGKDVIEHQKDNIRSAVDAGRQAYHDALQKPAPEPSTPNL